ncbi:MAG: trimeric autotransporter adhesin [Verrucomicrobiota bacterium]
MHTIAVQSALPALNSVITIDGYTQPGAKPNSLAVGTNAVLVIEINGSNLPAGQTGVTLGFAPGDAQTIRGLVINGFSTNVGVTDVGQHKIVACYLGTNPAGAATVPPSSGTSVDVRLNAVTFGFSATVGSSASADRNVVGFEINFASSAFPPTGSGVVQGNYVGISADGRSFINPRSRVSVTSIPVQIGGSADGAGNVIAGRVELAGTNGALVQRNLIGTDPTGTVASPGGGGLDLSWASIFHVTVPTRSTTVFHNVIVSADPARAAVVSILGGSTNTFQQNFIGVSADGKTPLGVRPEGIALMRAVLVDPANNTIGGTNIGDGNVIAFAAPDPTASSQPTAAGVTDGGARASYGRNFIEGNSITGSRGLGIDLGAAGVTPNDVGDADGIQNYPVLSSAIFANGTVEVTGSLNSQPDTSFSN